MVSTWRYMLGNMPYSAFQNNEAGVILFIFSHPLIGVIDASINNNVFHDKLQQKTSVLEVKNRVSL